VVGGSNFFRESFSCRNTDRAGGKTDKLVGNPNHFGIVATGLASVERRVYKKHLIAGLGEG